MKKSKISPYEQYENEGKNEVILYKFVEKHKPSIYIASFFIILCLPCLYFIPDCENDGD